MSEVSVDGFSNPSTRNSIAVQSHHIRHVSSDGADFFAINPKGQVPTLMTDDGAILTEGPVIAQFIADSAKATALLPAAGTLARYRVLEWQNYITAGVQLPRKASSTF